MCTEHSILMQMFGRPRGVLGRLGGIIMALTKRQVLSQMIDLLNVEASDEALEIGFGPGVGIHILAERISAGQVRGIDSSPEMVEQATTRNAPAIQRGLVELRLGSAKACPSQTIILTKCWPSTPCKSGAILPPDYEKFAGSLNPPLKLRSALQTFRNNRRKE